MRDAPSPLVDQAADAVAQWIEQDERVAMLARYPRPISVSGTRLFFADTGLAQTYGIRMDRLTTSRV
jgi:hypothetical protein